MYYVKKQQKWRAVPLVTKSSIHSLYIPMCLKISLNNAGNLAPLMYCLIHFFYGMKQGEEITIDLEVGKTLNPKCQAIDDTDDEGNIKIFSSSTVNPEQLKCPTNT